MQDFGRDGAYDLSNQIGNCDLSEIKRTTTLTSANGILSQEKISNLQSDLRFHLVASEIVSKHLNDHLQSQ